MRLAVSECAVSDEITASERKRPITRPVVSWNQNHSQPSIGTKKKTQIPQTIKTQKSTSPRLSEMKNSMFLQRQ